MSGGKHTAWLRAVEFVPLGHAAQFRLLVEEPSSTTYCPGSQSLHFVQLTSFVLALNQPPSQAVHTRSETSVGASATRSPGKHLVASTQSVAGLPS